MATTTTPTTTTKAAATTTTMTDDDDDWAVAYFDNSCRLRGDVLVGGSGGRGVDSTSTAPDSGSASLDATVFQAQAASPLPPPPVQLVCMLQLDGVRLIIVGRNVSRIFVFSVFCFHVCEQRSVKQSHRQKKMEAI